MKEAYLCEHANENPHYCPCDADCYCKQHTCKKKHPRGTMSNPHDPFSIQSGQSTLANFAPPVQSPPSQAFAPQQFQQPGYPSAAPAYAAPDPVDWSQVRLGGGARVPNLPVGPDQLIEVVSGAGAGERDAESGRKLIKVQKGGGTLLALYVKRVAKTGEAEDPNVYSVKFWTTSQFAGGETKLFSMICTAFVSLFGLQPHDPKARQLVSEVIAKQYRSHFEPRGVFVAGDGREISLLGRRALVSVVPDQKKPGQVQVFWRPATA